MSAVVLRSRFVVWAFASMVGLVACSGTDTKSSFPAGEGNGGSNPGGGSGTGGGSNGGASNGGTSNGGTSNGGTSNGGASNGGVGGKEVCDIRTGTVLPGSACYVGCEYAAGSPPRYDTTGVCTKFGWKCSVLQYCNPQIHCQVDATCEQYGGPGWLCVPTPTGPLVGECAIRCETDADCPQNTATASPYKCNPFDNGAGTIVKICRF